jgi:hypothetical protein
MIIWRSADEMVMEQNRVFRKMAGERIVGASALL